VARPPPSANDPTSPIKMSAGCALYQRKPRDAPVIAPQKMVNSEAPGVRARSRYLARSALPDKKDKAVMAPAAMSISPMASPSRPSVKFTAFEAPTSTIAMKAKKKLNASGKVQGLPSQA